MIGYLNRRDLYQTILLPAIQEAHETIKSNLRNQRESFDENFARYTLIVKSRSQKISTVIPGFRVLGFSALPGFRALKAGDGAWSVHKMLFGFRAPVSQLLIEKILGFFTAKESNFAP